MLKHYINLLKIKVIFGNMIAFTGGFFFASKGKFNFFLFLESLTAIFLVMSSSCIFNNLIDINIDKKMQRTKNRIYSINIISKRKIFLYGTILGLLGLCIFYFFINTTVVYLSIIGFVIYVLIYSYIKIYSQIGLFIGSIAGSIPPIIGYCTVFNKINFDCLILFFIFFIWQIPHFYSIAILYVKDYKLANIPILPIKNIFLTKIYIIIFIILFTFITMLLTIFNYTGYYYLIINGFLNILWLLTALQLYKSINNNFFWARISLIMSIVVISAISVMISIDFK